MMLLVLVVTAVFATSPAATAFAYAAKPGCCAAGHDAVDDARAADRDAGCQPAPEVVLPRPITTIVTPGASQVLGGPAGPRSAAMVPQPSPEVASRSVATLAPARDVSALSATSSPSPKAIPPSAPAALPERDSAAIKPPIVAPADAVSRASAEARAAVASTRIDPRTVVSVRSSERFEPLYAVPIPTAGLRLAPPTSADSIVVYKRERTLVLYNRGVPIRTYFVALGASRSVTRSARATTRRPKGSFTSTRTIPRASSTSRFDSPILTMRTARAPRPWARIPVATS